GGGQNAAVDGQVVAVRDRLEVIEQDVRQVDVATEGRVRLREQVGLPGGEHAAGLEHDCRKPDVRGIGPVRAAIPDIGRDQLEISNAERFEGSPVDVRRLSVADLEVIDLQRIDGLEGVLPAALLDGRRVFDLLACLRQVQVDRRPDELYVTDELAREERSPVDAGAQALELEHRRVRMLVLRDDNVSEIERESDRVEVEF